ncbi:VOC family protein [Nocardioides sp. NPDC087217]|uniref:VOC family protein n=1 Tax=Nocardioides sp. NPDC087217 TaxID=3364335 RepID=UPI00382E8590
MMPDQTPDPESSVPGQLPRLDHVGIMVRDLEATSNQWQKRFGLSIASTFEAPALNIRASFFSLTSASIELFTIDEPAALSNALGCESAMIDHIALRFDKPLGEVILGGCTIRGPGRPDRIDGPFKIAGSDHVWTEPPGIDVLLQLIAPETADL